MQGKDGQQQTLFLISINFYVIRYQLKSNLHHFGKCLENMIVKQEREHSKTRRQQFVVVVVFHRHLFDPCGSFQETIM